MFIYCLLIYSPLTTVTQRYTENQFIPPGASSLNDLITEKDQFFCSEPTQCKFIIHRFARSISDLEMHKGEFDESLIWRKKHTGGKSEKKHCPGKPMDGLGQAIKTKQAAIPLYGCLPCVPIKNVPSTTNLPGSKTLANVCSLD